MCNWITSLTMSHSYHIAVTVFHFLILSRSTSESKLQMTTCCLMYNKCLEREVNRDASLLSHSTLAYWYNFVVFKPNLRSLRWHCLSHLIFFRLDKAPLKPQQTLIDDKIHTTWMLAARQMQREKTAGEAGGTPGFQVKSYSKWSNCSRKRWNSWQSQAHYCA